MLKDLVKKNRSYRRFDGNYTIEKETLYELVELARLSPSALNLQPLRFFISNDKETNGRIFQNTVWAKYHGKDGAPKEGERPSAYIIILRPKDISHKFDCDYGICAQSILLGAVEKGLGGCMIASIERDNLRQTLSIPEKYEILLVIALGKPVETVVIEEVGEDGNIKYWRDEKKIHHVPKRALKDLIIEKF